MVMLSIKKTGEVHCCLCKCKCKWDKCIFYFLPVCCSQKRNLTIGIFVIVWLPRKMLLAFLNKTKTNEMPFVINKVE